VSPKQLWGGGKKSQKEAGAMKPAEGAKGVEKELPRKKEKRRRRGGNWNCCTQGGKR
jgi:hypothetical protein